mgnify:CR=1 FL=1
MVTQKETIDEQNAQMIEQVQALANAVSRTRKREIHHQFNKYMKHFALTGEHKRNIMAKLFRYYNTHFGVMGTYEAEDLDCDDCIKAVSTFWGYVIYDVWQREMI